MHTSISRRAWQSVPVSRHRLFDKNPTSVDRFQLSTDPICIGRSKPSDYLQPMSVYRPTLKGVLRMFH